MYKRLLGKKLKALFVGINVVAGLSVCLILLNTILASYIKHQNKVAVQLNDILKTAKHLESEKEKMLNVIGSFQKMIGEYKPNFLGVTSMYRAYDEIAGTIKGFSIDFIPAKLENNIFKMPITIKGKARDKLTIAAISEYLQGFSYPFVNIFSVSIKVGEKDLDVTISGEIVSYDLRSLL